ncbi:MAG TPA: propionyl-CoA synthetase [Stellaceae bacterium]
MSSRYEEVYCRSLTDPEGFWAEAAAMIDWDRRWDRVFDDSRPPFYRWFTGGRLNTCYNALDRHVAAGHGERIALIYDSPVTNQVRRYTYAELTEETARLAGAISALGVAAGDRVVIYMPMVPEAAMAMLACARIGAIHSVVFGGFAGAELAARIEDAKPKLVLSASCGIEVNRIIAYKPLLDQGIELSAHKPDHCLILQRPQGPATMIAGRDLDWREAVAAAPPADCVSVAATDPLYVLYTSGTTGVPKGIIRDNGGHAVALAWSMKYFFGMEPGQVFMAGSDVGWVVGHSYIVYGPLLYGLTTVLYEGKPVGTPDAGAYWRLVRDHKINAIFTAPTAFRAIRRDDPDGKLIRDYDRASLATLFLAGERCDPPTIAWAEQQLGIPVIDHWWQTETGWPMAGNCVGLGRLPVKHGSVTKPVPGWDLHVLDPQGNDMKPGEIGAICMKLPLAPGSSPTLWNADQRFIDAYLTEFPGYYATADAGYIDEDGYVYVMTRTDDVINVAGHRLSTGAMEEVVAAHRDVAECAVIGIADPLKGQVPLGFIVLKAGTNTPHEVVSREVLALIRARIGAVASLRDALVVQRLPKTRSGKILRGTMRHIADGEDYKVPATIDDPAILDEITAHLRQAGLAKAAG